MPDSYEDETRTVLPGACLPCAVLSLAGGRGQRAEARGQRVLRRGQRARERRRRLRRRRPLSDLHNIWIVWYPPHIAPHRRGRMRALVERIMCGVHVGKSRQKYRVLRTRNTDRNARHRLDSEREWLNRCTASRDAVPDTNKCAILSAHGGGWLIYHVASTLHEPFLFIYSQ